MKLTRAHKSYGSLSALDVDAFEVERGRIYSIIGSNGSGKTTLLRVLAGQLALDSGSIDVNDDEHIGYMPQKSYAFYGTVEKNILLGSAGRGDGIRASENAQTAKSDSAHHDDDAAVDEDARGISGIWGKTDKHRMQALLELLSIDGLAKAKAKRLSGGETARMALARLLMGDYAFLLLDEPTAALDVTSTLSAEQLIDSYRTAFNAGVVIVTHSVKQAERLSDEILFMDGGRIIERGPAGALIEHPQTEELRRFLEVAGA